jgi:capsule polysaccharide export protein KpsE/RkpR
MKFLIVLALAAIVYSANGQPPDKTQLLERAANLETQATAAVKKLQDGGKAAEATRLEAEAKRLQTIATELKAATANNTILRLETEIRGIEMRIAEELRRIERGGSTTAPATTAASLVKRDVRDDLLARAASLETQATAAVKKLQDGGKAAEATRLETEAKRLQTIATELKAATADATIRRLETEIRGIETRIAEELRRIERGGSTTAPATTAASFVKRNESDPLVAKAAALEKKANDEIKKLIAAGKKEDAATLEKEEKALQKLAEELKAATDAAEIKRLDTEVKASEKKINDELKRLEGKDSTTVATTST